MKYQSKSIKTVFNNHRNELYMFLQRRDQFDQLKAKVSEILDSDELKGNESVVEAKNIFNNCSNNFNRYTSTLVTYLTGIKAGI